MDNHPDTIEEYAIGCSSCVNEDDGSISYCRVCCETMLDWTWDGEL